jgi:hypothetical protein
MELKPWGSYIGRLATAAGQAIALLRDAVTVLEARAESLARAGKRAWEISPDMPALVIIIDECAELKDEAPDAISDADAIARLGRALAVTLSPLPSGRRKRPRGRRDGLPGGLADKFPRPRAEGGQPDPAQGMLRAGWEAHKLNAPGKFLVSAPEHDSPNTHVPTRSQTKLSPIPPHATPLAARNWTRYPGRRSPPPAARQAHTTIMPRPAFQTATTRT